MTKMFHSKLLLDMGLQKSLDLEKNGFSWYIIQPPNYFSKHFFYNLNILSQTAQKPRIQTFSPCPMPKYALFCWGTRRHPYNLQNGVSWFRGTLSFKPCFNRPIRYYHNHTSFIIPNSSFGSARSSYSGFYALAYTKVFPQTICPIWNHLFASLNPHHGCIVLTPATNIITHPFE